MIEDDALSQTYPLTAAQASIWASQELHPEVPLYNMAFLFELAGAVNEDAFVGAFSSLVDEVLDSEGDLPAADRERLRSELGDFPAFAEQFTARFPERVGLDAILREVYVPLYDAAFTEQELREIVRFYRSTAGRKLLVLAPAIGEQGMRETLPRVEPRVMALVGEILADRRGR